MWISNFYVFPDLRMPCENMKGCLYQYRNCRLLRDHQLVTDDLWVRDGKIMDPEKLFFEEKVSADLQIDCCGNIISPGFIETQINGMVTSINSLRLTNATMFIIF